MAGLIASLKRVDKRMFLLAWKYLFLLDFAALATLWSVYSIRLSPAPKYRPEIFGAELAQGEILSFPNFAEPTVSVIIPVFNQWNHTVGCLRSILANTRDASYEVIVADDGSSDETADMAGRVANVTVLRNRSNLQFLKNCNHAAAKARGKYLLFLNNDTCVQNDWLRSLVQTAEADPGVGIVGPKLVYPDGRLQEAGGIVWRDGSAWNYGWYDDPEKEAYGFPREVDYVSGACLLVRRELWESAGGFDERFAPAYYEDTDLCFTARRQGYKVVYQPASVVVHSEGVSCGVSLVDGIKRHQTSNREKFREKWREVLATEHFERGRKLSLASNRGLRNNKMATKEGVS